jgi:ParB-like chromosome segregation protein Spo0J
MDEQFPQEKIAVCAIGVKYAALRIIKPRTVALMEKSMAKYGQLSPIVCVRSGSGVELIDGFKRLQACRRLRNESLTTRILDASERACKAAIIQLNQAGGSISDLEEAMVLCSLYREDKLTQPEIALLVGRHKSWVSRRISLIEKVSEDVQQNIRLGLLPVVSGREVSRLPRGNQKEAADAIIKHGLSTREASKLISQLLSRPRWEYSTILGSPWELFENPPARSDLRAKLLSMQRVCRSVSDGVCAATPEEVETLSELMEKAVACAGQAVKDLRKALEVNP